MTAERVAAVLLVAWALLTLLFSIEFLRRLNAAEGELAATQRELWQCVAEQQGESGPLR
jgi:hypothetical protein